jgi:predicted PurR-regulated permease PerM
MTNILQDHGLVRSMLAVLLIGILIITTLWILRPFFPSIIWATMVVVATWPIMLKTRLCSLFFHDQVFQ